MKESVDIVYQLREEPNGREGTDPVYNNYLMPNGKIERLVYGNVILIIQNRFVSEPGVKQHAFIG